ncbi:MULTISPECIES: sigma factor [unclassified Mycolicibacterium]|uniref:sigma factor n=1 Tax=unclassified Mycolicibacterium TaxID=2636767 RepID=UPI002ED7C82E
MTPIPAENPAAPYGDPACRFAREAPPYMNALTRRARRLTLNDFDADDLVQDAMLNAYKSFHTFKHGTNLQAWLFKILYNRWVSNYRANTRRVEAERRVDQFTDRDLARIQTKSAETEIIDAMP